MDYLDLTTSELYELYAQLDDAVHLCGYDEDTLQEMENIQDELDRRAGL